MKKLVLFSAISLALSGQAMAGGWKLPENSINGTALSAANIANAHGADASYYNPAAMAFNEDGASLEGALTLVHLSGIEYSGIMPSDESEIENIPVPDFHYVGPAMGNLRFGFSAITPGGLSKRWKGTGMAFAEEFTLKTLELNPSIAYKVNDQFSVGAGARVIYSEGVVKSDAGGLSTRDLEGDSFDYGYNIALMFKPTETVSLAATYRSKIDLTEEGNAVLAGGLYDGFASVTIPIPASLNLAAAFDITDRTTIELVYEKTYWSAYKDLDFDYSVDLTGGALAAFDNPIPKNWEDSDTYRIGLTHQLDSKWTLMAGFAYDKTPAQKQTAGFELPDSDAKIFSFGARYQYSDNLNIGAALLYDKKDKLEITSNDNALLEPSTFEDATAILLTAGIEYKF
jgi:long-chain fatty acid transport protein